MHKSLLQISVLTAIVIAGISCISIENEQQYEITKITLENLIEIPPLEEIDEYGFPVHDYEIEEGTIRRNESFYVIFRRYGLSPLQIDNIQRKVSDHANLNRLRPGQTYRIYQKDGEPLGMAWNLNRRDFITVNWEDEDIEVNRDAREIQRIERTASGTIERSLYETLVADGLSPNLGSAIAQIYGWEVDFFSLRPGDSFKVVYDELYIGDEYVSIGDVHAAEFKHRNRTKRAYRFDNGEKVGYYDSDGNSMERALLKAPFEYNQRVSSGFSHNRFHPILQERRPHYGVDYAAPTGTPIIAVGDGVVTEARYRGGNGNIVQIRHNSVYKTAYLHLSRFGPNIRAGTRVEQGQVIGYVGQTGLATGPHLCYRLYVEDRPVNSLTVDLPASESLDEAYMDEFEDYQIMYDPELDRLNEPVAVESFRNVAGADERN